MGVRHSIWILLVAAPLVVGCGPPFDVPTGDELVGYLDRLEFGPEWRLQSEEVAESPCEQVTDSCPRAVRTYRVDATEFPSSVSILQAAGLETGTLFQNCVDAPEEGCRTQGWDEDVVVAMTITSEHGAEVEVRVRAVEAVGPPPSD